MQLTGSLGVKAEMGESSTSAAAMSRSQQCSRFSEMPNDTQPSRAPALWGRYRCTLYPVVSSTCNPGVRIGTCLKRMSQHSHNDHYNMCCHLWRRLCCVRLCNCRRGEHNFDRPLQFTSIRLLMQRSVFQPCTIVIRPNRLSFPQSICLSFIKAVL